MRLGLYILLLTLFSNVGLAKTDYYPGLVKLIIGTHKIYNATTGEISKYKSDTVVFSFYKAPQDTITARQLSFYFDWSIIPRTEKIVEKDYHSWLRPILFDDDTIGGYFEIYLTCKSQRGDWLEVVVNVKTQETLWIKKDRNVKLKPWGIVSSLSFKPTTKIYSYPDTLATEIKNNWGGCFKILSVKGDWMQLTNNSSELELCGGDEKFRHVYDKVWTRFKIGDKLLIDIIVSD